MKYQCFVNPENNYIQDVAIEIDGQWVSRIEGKTLGQYQAEDPGVVLMDLDEFVAITEKRMTTDPVEISEECYWYLLEVLPPCGWVRNQSSESFYMSEFLSGSVTNHVVRLGGRYFSFDAPVMANHSDRVAKVQEWLSSQEVAV